MDKYSESDNDISMEHVVNATNDVVEPNRIIQGEIVTIDDEFVYVNVGTKSEGKVSLEEFEEAPAVGSMITIMLMNKRMIDGMLVFSKIAAEREEKWLKFIEYYRQGNTTILGTIKNTNNNGIVIDCDGMNAFLPFSQAADLKVRKRGEQGPYEFKIKSIDNRKKSVVLSRKEFVEEERQRLWDKFTSQYAVGDVVAGTVIKLIESGALVNVNGIIAKVNKDDLSWRKVFKKKKILKIREERDFKILDLDHAEKNIVLGIKQLTEDPWERIEEKYQVDQIVYGETVTVATFGVFVEIEEGVEGLISASNISWTKKSVNPKELYQKGQRVEAVILEIEKEGKKLSLGVKQLTPNPWETIDERFPVGSVLKKKIKKIINYGIFVELEDDIDGMIHVSDITWDKSVKNPIAPFQVGDEIEFKILEIRKDEMKISCGIKQLLKSPWEEIKEKYLPRSKVSGVISGIAPFGLFVRLEDGIEGLVHISEVSQRKISNLEDAFETGTPVEAIVLGVDVEKKRLSLSIKHFEIISEKEDLNRVLNSASPGKVTIGDIIKNKMGE